MKYLFSTKGKFVHHNENGVPRCQGRNSDPKNWKEVELASHHKVCPTCEPPKKLSWVFQRQLDADYRAKIKEARRIAS